MINSCTNDRQQFISTVPAGYTVVCACHEGKANQETCNSLTVYSAQGKPVHTFVGRQYRCAQAPSGEITFWTERPTITSDTKPIHTDSWETPVRKKEKQSA
jgi:hypothetical protein